MSEFREFAKESAALSVACLSLLWVPPLATAIVPLAALSALGRDLWRKCPERVTEAAIASVLADMQAAGIPEAHLAAARTALAALPGTARLDTKTLITAARSDAGFDTALLAAILSHLPQGTDYDIRALVETALATGLRTCRAHPGFRATLTEALVLDTAREVGLVLQGIARLETAVAESTALALDNRSDVQRLLAGLEGATRPELDTLAHRFGHPAPESAGLTDLKAFLHDKAEEYQALRKSIDAIDERTAGLGNLKAAAKDAIERLDLAEVEALLARVDAVETTIAAETKELRADNALLRGRAQDAFTHLSAAADSFTGIDPLEPARRRHTYMQRLYQHGLRYGGLGLGLAAQMISAALARIDRDVAPDLWALAQNSLASALANQGIRTSGAKGATLLAQAATAYRAALKVWTRATHPMDWARAQNNLGNTLANQGIRTGGAEGAALLAQAVKAYRAARQVWSYAAHPVLWATTQSNLGNALMEQSEYTGDPGSAALLSQAVRAYRAALKVWDRNEHSWDWAMTRNNLGNTLQRQGTRTVGTKGTALLAQATTAFREAIEVWDRADHPVHCAIGQNNLGNALREQGCRTNKAEGAALLTQALTACRAALEVLTQTGHPVDWAKTQENLALTHLALSVHDTCTDPLPPLRAALDHVEASLTVYDPDHMPYDHGTATALRDRILARLRDLGAAP